MPQKILYINPLWEKIFFATIFDNLRQENYLDIPFLQFAEKFPKILNEYITKNSINEIWIIAGPGTFTKMRIITLAVNAIKFSHPEIIIKSAHFFDIIPKNNHIPIIQANKTEFLIQENEKNFFVHKENLLENSYIGYTSDKNFPFPFIPYFDNIDNIDNFDKIIEHFSTIGEEKFISPIYIKWAHITQPKY